MEFYHIDRRGFLSENQVIDLIPSSTKGNKDIFKEHANFMFPRGLSEHGKQYLNAANSVDSITEWFYEYIRRTDFYNRPSRFESVFAFGNMVDLQRFRTQSKMEQIFPIYKIQSSNFFKADMNLVGNQPSPLATSLFAHYYWSGETNIDINKKFNLTPLWEYLLTGPIKVLERIE
ncbi:hypothetical protein [Cytobacillus kochii]|uniref:hypothetical protein n=1 Tax=Cytobacillus kochii TaxID=859143 RepID=UPI003F80C1C5